MQALGPTRINTVLNQGHPIAAGCDAVILRVPAIQSRGSTLRPIIAVFTIGGQKLGEVAVVVTPVGGTISSISEGVPLVSGSQNLLDGPHTLDKCRLPRLQSCQPPLKVVLTFIGNPIDRNRHQHRLPLASCGMHPRLVSPSTAT